LPAMTDRRMRRYPIDDLLQELFCVFLRFCGFTSMNTVKFDLWGKT
jgi:hypothetical protein